MSESELKRRIHQMIEGQHGEQLEELYQMLTEKLHGKQQGESMTLLEQGYLEMSQDIERERDAVSWIEGTLSS